MSTEDPFHRSFNNRTSALSLLKYHKFQAYQLKNELREFVSFLPTRKKRFKIEDIYLSDDVCKVKLKPKKKKLYRNIIITEEKREGDTEGRRKKLEDEVEIPTIVKKIDEKKVAIGEREGKFEGKQDKNVGIGKGNKEENGGREWNITGKCRNFEEREINSGERIEGEEEEEEVSRKLKFNPKWNKNLDENKTLDFHWKIKRSSQAKFESFSKTSKNFRIKTAKVLRKNQNGGEKQGETAENEEKREDERFEGKERSEISAGIRGRVVEEYVRRQNGGGGRRKGGEKEKRDKPFLYKERNEMGSVCQFMSKYLEFTAKL